MQSLRKKGPLSPIEEGALCPDGTTAKLWPAGPFPPRQLSASAILHILDHSFVIPWFDNTGAKRFL